MNEKTATPLTLILVHLTSLWVNLNQLLRDGFALLEEIRLGGRIMPRQQRLVMYKSLQWP